MPRNIEIQSRASDKNKVDYSESQDARLRRLRAEHQRGACDESKKEPTIFEQQRQRQQKELSQKAKVNYDDPTVPRLGGGMDKNEQKGAIDFLTEEEKINRRSGKKKDSSIRTKKEQIAIETYNIAVNRNRDSLTDKEIERRMNKFRQEKRYKEAFGGVSCPGESSHSEGARSGQPHTQASRGDRRTDTIEETPTQAAHGQPSDPYWWTRELK